MITDADTMLVSLLFSV
jgi:hypothetical protein